MEKHLPQPDNSPESTETLIEFPCDFPIKVMGETHADFTAEIVKTIQQLNPGFSTAEYRNARQFWRQIYQPDLHCLCNV